MKILKRHGCPGEALSNNHRPWEPVINAQEVPELGSFYVRESVGMKLYPVQISKLCHILL